MTNQYESNNRANTTMQQMLTKTTKAHPHADINATANTNANSTSKEEVTVEQLAEARREATTDEELDRVWEELVKLHNTWSCEAGNCETCSLLEDATWPGSSPTTPPPTSPTRPATSRERPSSSSPPPSTYHHPPSRPAHKRFHRTGHPSLHSHHYLPQTLDETFYNTLTDTLKKDGLRAGKGRIEVIGFAKNKRDNISEYLIRGRYTTSGPALKNKPAKTALLRPQWLRAGVEECGKCGSSFGLQTNKKAAKRLLRYHLQTHSRPSRATNEPYLEQPENTSCKPVAKFIYTANFQ